METIIYHIDVNSAFLSWIATYQMKELHSELDIRNMPSAVGGSEASRHGIVLAKSTPAKKYGIRTGEPLANARRKCPNLTVVAPDFSIFVQYSNQFVDLLKRYAPEVDQYSIDECFCDMSGTRSLYGDPVEFAYKLKDMIKDELGFTVNIGISCNRLLAKMASDFQKPDRVHTLFPEEVPAKMWPLPIEDLFFTGHSAAAKLRSLGICTIGDLANTDPKLLTYHLKGQGQLLWEFANGNDSQLHKISKNQENKGYGNSTTISYDVTDSDTAKLILLSLCETVGARLRVDQAYISVIAVQIRDNEFRNTNRQITLDVPTNVTDVIYEHACRLFDELWDHTPIRLLGVHTSKASKDVAMQYDLFNQQKYEKLSKLDSSIDKIRSKYGDDSIMRASFLDFKH